MNPAGSRAELKLLGVDLKHVPSCWRPTRRTKGCIHWKRCPLKKGKPGRSKKGGPYMLNTTSGPLPCYTVMRMVK